MTALVLTVEASLADKPLLSPDGSYLHHVWCDDHNCVKSTRITEIDARVAGYLTYAVLMPPNAQGPHTPFTLKVRGGKSTKLMIYSKYVNDQKDCFLKVSGFEDIKCDGRDSTIVWLGDDQIYDVTFGTTERRFTGSLYYMDWNVDLIPDSIMMKALYGTETENIGELRHNPIKTLPVDDMTTYPQEFYRPGSELSGLKDGDQITLEASIDDRMRLHFMVLHHFGYTPDPRCECSIEMRSKNLKDVDPVTVKCYESRTVDNIFDSVDLFFHTTCPDGMSAVIHAEHYTQPETPVKQLPLSCRDQQKKSDTYCLNEACCWALRQRDLLKSERYGAVAWHPPTDGSADIGANTQVAFLGANKNNCVSPKVAITQVNQPANCTCQVDVTLGDRLVERRRCSEERAVDLKKEGEYKFTITSLCPEYTYVTLEYAYERSTVTPA